MTTTFETASVGDRVWSITLGWGVVKDVLHGVEEFYPVVIDFDSGGRETFTRGGLIYKDDIHQSLFWDEVEIKAPTKPKPKPKLNKDDCVEVWNDNIIDPTITYKRHFSHFEDDNIFCFENGGTSWTSIQTVGWNRWRIPK